jgi:ribonuclease T2
MLHEPASEPGAFDIYILAQSWSPHFCCMSADRCTTVPWAFSARHLSLHGLWPSYAAPRPNGTKYGSPSPTLCNYRAALTASQLPRDYIDLAPSFTKWNSAEHKAEIGALAKHEWLKHGTCSGLTPDGYFGEALKAMKYLPGDRGTPALLSEKAGA